MKKKAVLVSVTLAMVLVAGQLWAGWQNMEPTVVGGTLTPRHAMAFVHVAEDKVMMFGGRDTNALADTWIYDISDNRWTKQTNLNVVGSRGPLAYSAVSSIGGDRVLVMGGWASGVRYNSQTWLYDYSQNKWNLLSPTINGTGWGNRGHGGMSYLGGDKVLLFGGYKYRNTNLADTWIYDLSENSWTQVTPTVSGGDLTARHSMSLANVGEGKVIGFGGYDGGFKNETWLYDQGENSWTLLSPEIVGGPLQGKRAPGLTNIGGDRLLMFGGQVAASYAGENDLWLYDYSENSWTMIEGDGATLPPARCNLGFTAVGASKAVLFAGDISTYNNNFSDTWIFNLPESGAASFSAAVESGGISLSWSQDTESSGNSYYIYKNNTLLSEEISVGVEEAGRIQYSYLDSDTVSGTLIRYKLLEVNSDLNSETFSTELTVPYCD
jgi:Galactose oxidase, central domain/Kelch motif